MRPRLAIVLFACLLAALALATSGCGADAIESSGAEGEPIDVGDLTYNVQITRFLNPKDKEDAQYLVGQPPLPVGKSYLGVFIVIDNPTSDPQPSATDYTVIDTLDNHYKPSNSESPYALDIGSQVPADEQLPLPDTTPYAAFNKGSLLIFEVDQEVSENRPLRMAISGGGEEGEITLDI